MTYWDAQTEQLPELANLPSGHPGRTELEAQINLMDAPKRENWRNILRETDALYLDLAQVQVPAELEDRLLLIPSQRAAKRGRLERFLAEPMGWKHLAAACALIAIGILAYTYWPQSTPTALDPLDPMTADKIATLAIQRCEAQAALDISTDDAGKVQAALASHNLPISVEVTAPQANLVLRGGGACNFGLTYAVYTRWQASNLTYTLFQFNGIDLRVPPSFRVTVASPTALSHGALRYHVVIWPGPGQQGDWALVLENDQALAGFMRSCH
jgi:hypothetical protein